MASELPATIQPMLGRLAREPFDYPKHIFELKRNGEGDRPRAVVLLDESLAISSELGMGPLVERVLFRLEVLGA